MTDLVYVDDESISHRPGDRAYCYYTMRPGTIGRDLGDGWFDFDYDDGTSDMLNGQRICRPEHAEKMGWPNPRSEPVTA